MLLNYTLLSDFVNYCSLFILKYSKMSSPAPSPKKQFSQVSVRESPLSKPGNLTGNPRRLRDCAADFYNYVQNWNKNHLEGAEVICEIVRLIRPSLSSAEKSLPAPELQVQIDKLETITNTASSIISEMQTICQNLSALSRLEKLRSQNTEPLFLTWPTDKYVEVLTKIMDCYSQEGEVKLVVKENIAHAKSQDELMFYCALWVNQPYIPDRLNLDLDSLIKETGFTYILVLIRLFPFS